MSGAVELGARDPREIGGYRLLKKLGGGGQGTVYLGADGSDGDERVAVKVLNTDFDDTGRLKSTLNRELESARSVAAFVTAGVISFDLDADPPYIVTEFVDGPTLQEEVVSGRGPLRGSRLNDLAIQTVLALEAIHGANVVHCDFKPANIILGPSGVKVIDFGIARAWEQMHQAASRVIGSAHFMAPEQVENKPLGPPVDMFAWASAMVFAATGKYTFTGPSPLAVGLAVVQSQPQLHGLTGPLAELVMACLHKDPARRPTAGQVRQRLMAPSLPAHAPTSPAPAPAFVAPAPASPASAPARPAFAPPVRFVDPPPRRRGLSVLVFFLVLLLLGGGGTAGYLWWDSSQPETTPGASPGEEPSPTAEPAPPELQDFAKGQPLDDCAVIDPKEGSQVARRSCTVGGFQVTYALYLSADLRDKERERVETIHDGSPPECLTETGISPDGREGEYIEYTYKGGDDDKWYAALWWDDGKFRPEGAGVMTMRTSWDRQTKDPARPLREAWLNMGYRLAN